uniref:Tetratricopeptide repeat protein 29 n=1 Tax=Sipha flava TaxID=143950 RepID=A0A2S2QPB7_9HEMI
MFSYTVPRCCDRSSGRGTKFDQWSDKPVTNGDLPRVDRKLYRNIKSRYAEKRDRTATTAMVSAWNKDCWEQLESDNLAVERPRSVEMSAAHLAYLEFVEADGQLDGAASVLGYLLEAERVCRVGQLQPLHTAEFERVRLALAESDGSPLGLVRAALAFVRGDGPADGDIRDEASPRWSWAAELCVLAAASRANADGGKGPVAATCLFAAGWLYARNDRPQTSMRFLESARQLADDGHRRDWLLPDDVADATGAVTEADGGRVSTWVATCYVEIGILMAAAGGLDADRALLAVRTACRLAEQCDMDDGRRAPILHELGVRYAAVNVPDRAVKCFKECAAVAAGTRSGLDLEARVREAVVAGPGPEDDRVLQRIADEALDRRCGRALVKAIAARGQSCARRGMTNVAGRHFALAHRLATDPDVDDADTALSARLNAAVCQTSVYLQSNFQQLSRVGFNLLATEAPRRWTGTQSSLVQRDSEGRMYLDVEHYRDAVVKSQARKILGRLSQIERPRESREDGESRKGGSVEAVEKMENPVKAAAWKP